MVNEQLVAQVKAAIRESARSHGVKGSGQNALVRHFNEKTSRRRHKPEHGQLSGLILAMENLKPCLKFKPTPVREQIANHAARLAEILEEVRECHADQLAAWPRRRADARRRLTH